MWDGVGRWNSHHGTWSVTCGRTLTELQTYFGLHKSLHHTFCWLVEQIQRVVRTEAHDHPQQVEFYFICIELRIIVAQDLDLARLSQTTHLTEPDLARLILTMNKWKDRLHTVIGEFYCMVELLLGSVWFNFISWVSFLEFLTKNQFNPLVFSGLSG